MFKRLRNKFLILNMSMTSMVMIAALAIIYLSTYSNMQTENQNKLNALSGKSLTLIGSEGKQTGLPDDASSKEKGGMLTRVISSSYSLSFTIDVDADGHVLNIDSFIEMPDETYNEAAERAWKSKKDYSIITLNGKQWMYKITQPSMTIIKDGQQYSFMDGRYQLSFLDVTEFSKTLKDLLITFLIVGMAMLAAIFIISHYFAIHAIKPITEAWNKQRQFIADASHELKTPLSIINANYDVLLSNKEATIQSQLKWLEYMKIGSDRMAKLINDLLSLAKMEDADIAANKAPFDISDTIHEVMLSMEAAVREKGLGVSASIDSGIMVNSDKEMIKQVFAIIYDNAIKYADENGQIDVSLRNSKGYIVCVKNSGKGIAKQDLPKIFDRFYRADLSRTGEKGGYGLGLSIAKRIIDRLGGEITASSIENGWTTFTFTLAE